MALSYPCTSISLNFANPLKDTREKLIIQDG